MILKHVKMRNREDLLCYVEGKPETGFLRISHPLCIEVTPDSGMFAKNWMMFTDGDSVNVPVSSIMYIGDANEKAIQYYDDFFTKLQSSPNYDDDADFAPNVLDEYEELFQAMMESKKVIKH